MGGAVYNFHTDGPLCSLEHYKSPFEVSPRQRRGNAGGGRAVNPSESAQALLGGRRKGKGAIPSDVSRWFTRWRWRTHSRVLPAMRQRSHVDSALGANVRASHHAACGMRTLQVRFRRLCHLLRLHHRRH